MTPLALAPVGSRPRLLVACEFSGVVRDAFIARGWDAWSCDVIPTERKGPHIVNDVRNVLDDGWDLMIAHPPCTYLTRTNWRARNTPQEKEAIRFVDALWNAPIPHIAIENPQGVLSWKTKTGYIWRHYDDLIQPWMFGHGETKGTCLWLKGLPPLMRTLISDGRDQRLYRLSPSPTRSTERSRTFPGIAAAMAEQWGRIA